MNYNKWHARIVRQADTVLLCAITAILAWLAVAAWFDPLRFTVLAGDDLRAFDTLPHNGFVAAAHSFTRSINFRPVSAFLMGSIAGWTDGDFRGIALISVGIHAVNATMFFLLLHRVIGLPPLASLGLTTIAALNRFATYIFLQEQAIMEGCAITVFLIIVSVSAIFIERPKIRSALVIIFFFLLLIHIHERYLVLVGSLVFLGIFAGKKGRKAGLILGAGVVGTVLLNLWTKLFWLGSPVLMGTGGTPIKLRWLQVCQFMWQGVLNLFGINRGPAYLSLEDFASSPSWVQLVSVLTAMLCCLVLAWTVRRALGSEGPRRRAVLVQVAFYLLTIISLLLSASVTFRQEYRWLYPAYLTLLALLAFGARLRADQFEWPRLALTLLVLLSISREIYLARRHENFFAVEAYDVANNLTHTLHDVASSKGLDAVVIRGEVPSKEWIFMAGTFSRYYRLPFLEFVQPGSPIEQTDQSRLVLDYSNSNRSFRIAHDPQTVSNAYHRMSYLTLERSAAALKPDDRWATPTKTPLFLMSKNGVNSMAVVAPVDIHVQVPQSASVLYVCFSHVYAMGDGADLEIAAITPGGSKPLLSRLVPPLVNDDFPVWRKYEFTLPVDTQQVELHVFSKTDPVADWIAVRDFSFD